MSYLRTRSNRMIKSISSQISQNSDKCGLIVLFEEKEYFVYKFKENKFSKSRLIETVWIEEGYLQELNWEQLKKVVIGIDFVNESDVSKWIESKKKSCFLGLYKNILNFIQK